MSSWLMFERYEINTKSADIKITMSYTLYTVNCSDEISERGYGVCFLSSLCCLLGSLFPHPHTLPFISHHRRPKERKQAYHHRVDGMFNPAFEFTYTFSKYTNPYEENVHSARPARMNS
jgi:hypothetical protein